MDYYVIKMGILPLFRSISALYSLSDGHLKYLKVFLDSVNRQGSCDGISGWLYQGQLILDYAVLMIELENILNCNIPSHIDAKFEILQPQLVSLCQRITIFPSKTIKSRVCQVEMAKRTVHLTKSLLELQSQDDGDNDFLIHLISLLPLPEDYTQQELKPVLDIHVRTIH